MTHFFHEQILYHFFINEHSLCVTQLNMELIKLTVVFCLWLHCENFVCDFDCLNQNCLERREAQTCMKLKTE